MDPLDRYRDTKERITEMEGRLGELRAVLAREEELHDPSTPGRVTASAASTAIRQAVAQLEHARVKCAPDSPAYTEAVDNVEEARRAAEGPIGRRAELRDEVTRVERELQELKSEAQTWRIQVVRNAVAELGKESNAAAVAYGTTQKRLAAVCAWLNRHAPDSLPFRRAGLNLSPLVSEIPLAIFGELPVETSGYFAYRRDLDVPPIVESIIDELLEEQPPLPANDAQILKPT
jgi:hypothetical protein